MIEMPPSNPRAAATTQPDPDPEPEPEPEPEIEYGDDLSRRELVDAIREYALTVEIDVNLSEVEIEISDRLTRTAGKAIRHNGKRPKHGKPYTMRFAWKAYRTWGWERFAQTIRHELIHIWQYQRGAKGGHGTSFKTWASKLDCSVHCEPFGVEDAPFLLYCTDCGELTGTRQRRSKAVKNPGTYRTKCCKAPLRVEEN